MGLSFETLEEALGILGQLILDRGLHYEVLTLRKNSGIWTEPKPRG
jgi:hypothetical protein